ncbi:YciI-like protein [Arthrobacter sp. NPDC057388]|uniref:YciI-like protein n=1 Tax=Arthrobacter sp. NPDC057388 TaxID=3346116 RepID=UPI00363C7663
MHAVLEYTYADNYLDTREKYRAVHLKAAWEAVERGELLLGGAVGDGPFTGLLIFTGENALEAAKAFAVVDPYVTGGVVTSWTARLWTTVVGNEAATPVRPKLLP